MESLDYTVETKKSFDEAVEAVQAKSREKSFGVLHAYDVLEKDVKISLMLPCPISVYVENGRIFISALRPKLMSGFYPQAHIEAAAQAVDRAITAIVDESR
jgi:uncharacterized protein (DUF302 family)